MELIDKIKNFDLNLLAVFVAIDEQRHITKAAKILGLTQPALSHALARLRVLLGDQLFVKSSKGMVPTPKSELLSLPIRALLQTFDMQILRSAAFDPRALTRTFKIYTTDLIDCLLLPNLLQILENEAPKVQIISRSASFSLPREDLELGVCHLAIAGFFGDLPDGFYQQKLFSDSFLSAVRKSHPRLGAKKDPTLDNFCSERHILVAPGGELKAKVDDLLKARKKQRFVVAGLNTFMSSAWIAPQSDCIFTGPSRLIELMNRASPMHTFTPPVQIPKITIAQTWHERNNMDAGHKWLREKICRILQN
ncbi:MAG: LysR family transcriptional regulator [Proteobacteria bacterium]|nr:LysR family transcriptional regulator [Pseudomonadota bacterium]